MAKKEIDRGVRSIVLTEPYRIYSVFNRRALLPHNAIDSRYFRVWCKSPADWDAWKKAKFIVNDRKYVHIKFISFWNNSDNRFYDELNKVSEQLYDMPFSNIIATWASRFNGNAPAQWHLIEMEEI